MLRKAALTAVALVIVLAGALGYLYATNPTPVAPSLSTDEAADPNKPFVVKFHAQWCSVCMVTKSAWSQIESAYVGRVKLVVFDFTTDATADVSATHARRLGLDRFLEEYSGATGLVVVLDGRTREVLSELGGVRSFDDYRAAIDGALARSHRVE